MMKLKIFLFTLCVCRIMNAQNIIVDSCVVSKGDSVWALSPRTDINGHPCSIVKVISKDLIGKLEFKGNIIDVVYNNSYTYTLYVPDKTKRVKIYHPDYIPETIEFTNFDDTKYGLSSNKVYYLYLSACGTTNPSNISTPKGARVLIFSSDTELKSVFVDGNEWKIQNGNSSKRLISYGIHKYEVVNIDGLNLKGEVNLQPSLGSKIIKLDFGK